MSELVIPTGFINCHFVWKQALSKGFQSAAIGFDATAFTGNLDLFAAAIGNAWWTGFGAANILDSYTLVGTKLYLGPGDPFLVGESTLNLQGTSSGSPVPINTSMILKKKTGFAGVRFRGRMYWPAIMLAEGNVDGVGAMSGATRSAIQARFDLAFGAMDAVTGVGPFCLFHAPSEDSATPSPTTITSIQLEALCATQRRRMR